MRLVRTTVSYASHVSPESILRCSNRLWSRARGFRLFRCTCTLFVSDLLVRLLPLLQGSCLMSALCDYTSVKEASRPLLKLDRRGGAPLVALSVMIDRPHARQIPRPFWATGSCRSSLRPSLSRGRQSLTLVALRCVLPPSCSDSPPRMGTAQARHHGVGFGPIYARSRANGGPLNYLASARAGSLLASMRTLGALQLFRFRLINRGFSRPP